MSSHEEDAGTKVALAVTTTIVTSATDSSALTKEDDSKLGTMGSTQQHLAPKETRNGETAPASAVTRGKADSEEVIPKETPLRRSNRGKGRTLQIEKSGPDDRIQSCISGCIEYKPGDYVYYEEPDFDYYTIGLIEEIKLSRREKCSVVVKCFWRTRDIPEMAKQALLDREVVQQEAAAAAAMTENAGDHGAAIAEEWQQRQRRRQAILSRELFVSELQYTVYSNQLRGKCQIIQLPDLHTALRTFEPAEEDSFFFVFAYNPETRRLLSTRAEIKVGPAYQVASLPRCRRPLDPALWRHSRRRTDCRALKHRLREKNENVCRLLASTKSNGGVGSGDVVAPAEQHPHSVNGKRVSPPTTVDSTSVVGDPKRPRVKADHHHQHHRCRRHRLSETDDDSLLPAPPPRCWETLVWLPQGLRNGLKLVHGGFPGRILEDRQDSSGEDEELEGTNGVGDDSKRQGEHGVPPALNGGGILKERPAENDEDDDDFTLKTYLEAVRSLVAFCAFGGSDDDLISAENGLVLANLATTTQHAYDTLHRCGYNLANALETIKHNPIVSDDTPQHWTVEQVRRFYHAMAVRGKDFHVIHRDFFSAAAARQPRLAGGCGRRKPPPRLASPSRGKKRRGQANTVNLALLDPLVDRKPSERTDGVDPTVRPLKYSASVPNSLFSLSEDVATEEEDGEEELDDEEVEAEEQREVSEPKRPCFASDDDTKSAVAMDSANSTAVNIKSIFTKPEATDTKSGEPILVSAKPEAEEACATVTNGGQEEAKIKGETAGLDSTTTDEKTVSPAIFRPSREKTVKQLISFYYYWKRKSNSILPSASAFSSHYHSHPQQQHHQTTASFRGSCVETNFNTGISSRKKRPTGRGGVPLTVQAWSDILQGRLSAQEELSRRLLQQFHSHRHQHPLCDSPHSTISSAADSVNNSRPESESDDIDSNTPQRSQSVDADVDGASSDAGAANEAGSDALSVSKQRICRNCSEPISPSFPSSSSVGGGAGGNLSHSQSGSQLRFLCSVCRIHLRKYGELRPIARIGTDQPTSESVQTATQQSSEVPASTGINGNEGESDAAPSSPLAPPVLPIGELASTTTATAAATNTDASPDSVCSLCEAYSPTYATSVTAPTCCCALASPTETPKLQQQQTPAAPGVLHTVIKVEESEAAKESRSHSPSVPVVPKPEPHSSSSTTATTTPATATEDAQGSESSQLEIGDNRSALKSDAFHRMRTEPKAAETPQSTSTTRTGDFVMPVPRELDDQISSTSTTTAPRDSDWLTPEPVSAEEMAQLSVILRSQDVPPTACQTIVHRSTFGDLERIWDRSITLPPFTVPLTSSGGLGPVFTSISSPRVNSGSCARTDIILSHRRVRHGSTSPLAPKNLAPSDASFVRTVISAPTQPPPLSSWPTIQFDDTKAIPSNYLNSDCPMELTSKALAFKKTDFSSVSAVSIISSSVAASSQLPNLPSHGHPPNLTSLQQHPDYARYHQQLLEYVSRARELPPATAAAAAAAAAAEALKMKASEFGGGGGGLLTLEQQQMALLAAAAAASASSSAVAAACPVSLHNPVSSVQSAAVLSTSVGHLPPAFMRDPPSPPATATPAPTPQRLTAAGGTFYPPPGVPPVGPVASKSGRGGSGGHHHHHHHQQQQQQQQQQQYRQSTSQQQQQQQNPVLGGRSAHQRTPSGNSVSGGSIANSTSSTISGPHLSAPLGVCSGPTANLAHQSNSRSISDSNNTSNALSVGQLQNFLHQQLGIFAQFPSAVDFRKAGSREAGALRQFMLEQLSLSSLARPAGPFKPLEETAVPCTSVNSGTASISSAAAAVAAHRQRGPSNAAASAESLPLNLGMTTDHHPHHHHHQQQQHLQPHRQLHNQQQQQQQQQQQHFPRSGNLVDRHSLSPKQMKGGLPPHSVEPSSSSSHQSQHVAHQPTSRYSHLPPPSSSPTAYLPSPQQQQHLPPVSGGRGSNFSQSTDNSAVLGGAASGLQNAAVSAALHERMFAAAKAAFANANLSGDCASDSSKALTVATLAAAAVAEVVAQENQIHQQQQQQQLQRYFRSAGPPFCPLPSVSASQPPSLGSMSMSNGAGAGGNNSTGAAAAAAMFAHLQQHFQQQQQQQQKRQYPVAVPCSSSALLHGGGYPGGGQPHHQSSPISPQPQPPQSNKRASQTRMEHPPPPSSQQQQHHHHLSSQHLQHPPRLAHSGGAHSSNASAGGSGGPYRQSTPHTQTLDLLAAAAAAATNPALMTAAGVGAYPGSSLAAAVPSPSSSTAAAAAAAAAAAISAAQLTNLHPQQLSALFPGGLPMRDAAGTLAMMNAAAAAAIAATSRNAQISSSPTGPSMAGVCGGGGGSLAQVANQAAVADYLRFLSQLSAAGLSLPHSGSGGGGPGGGAGFSQQSSTR